jgi:hypothetical protein
MPYRCLYDTHMGDTGNFLTLGILEGKSDKELLLLELCSVEELPI